MTAKQFVIKHAPNAMLMRQKAIRGIQPAFWYVRNNGEDLGWGDTQREAWESAMKKLQKSEGAK